MTDVKGIELLECATSYLDKGFSIIPLSPRCKEPPEGFKWKEYQNRRPTEKELYQWFGGGAERNIGIITGAVSGIAVVDLDSAEAVDFARKHKFPRGPMVKTSKGYHLYCAHKDGVGNFQKRDDFPGIDLKGEGGYVVAPPSIHPSGKQYRWIRKRNLDDLLTPPLPEIILAKWQGERTPLKDLYKGMPEGSRNVALARLTGSWVNDGLSFEECLVNAHIWNSNNQPPLPEKEVQRTVRSIVDKHHRELSSFSTPWSEVIPFGSEIVPVSDVPIEPFPDSARDMIQAVAECTGQDSNVAAAVFFGALSAATRGRYTVKLPTHFEHATLYALAALPSGTMKDDILRFLTKPVLDWLSEKQKREKTGLAEARTRVSYLKKRHEALIQDASSTRARKTATEGFDREVILKQASDLALELEDEERNTIGTRILIDNATTEAVPRFLSLHGAGAVLSSEGRSFWNIVLGRYSDGKIDPDLLNKAYDAQRYDFDRAKESITLASPSLGIAQIVQNDLVSEIIANDRLRDCGLVHRFIFVIGKPKPPLPYDPERRPSARVRGDYAACLREMLDQADRTETGTLLKLSSDALEAWRPFHDQVKAKTVPPGGLSGLIAPWARKHPGRAIRLAALFHLFAGKDPRDPIGKADMLRAIAIMNELVPHALRAYEGAKDFSPTIERAKKIVDWLKREKRQSFTAYEAGTKVSPQIRKAEERHAAVQVLIDRGMVRPGKKKTPAQKLFEVNPAIL